MATETEKATDSTRQPQFYSFTQRYFTQRHRKWEPKKQKNRPNVWEPMPNGHRQMQMQMVGFYTLKNYTFL